MQHKFLLRFIKQEMQVQKIPFRNNESFFKLFLPDEPWEAYRSNLSNWLSSPQDGVIRKSLFIYAINDTLGLNPKIWGASESLQKQKILDAIAVYKVRLSELEMFFPCIDEVEMGEAQKVFVEESSRCSLEVLEAKVKEVKHFFTKSAKNQPFLLALFEQMYVRGAYDFVYVQIMPFLLESYDNAMKAKQADVYASLSTPMYREAFEVLMSIKGDDKAQTISLQTAAISNIRRERLSDPSLNLQGLEVLIETIIHHYTKLYVPKYGATYYTGLNLAYTVALASYIGVDVETYSIKQIYQDVEHQMLKDSSAIDKDTQYYGGISKIEFGLLLAKQGMVQELEYMLEMLTPSIYLTKQTLRQIETFYLALLEKFAKSVPSNIEDYKACIEVLKSYIQTQTMRVERK